MRSASSLSFLALLLSACYAPGGGESAQNSCGSDGDCSSGQCDRELGICAAELRGGDGYRYAVEITIPADRRIERPALTVTADPTSLSSLDDITIPMPIALSGELRAGSIRVTGDVVFTSVYADGYPITPNDLVVHSLGNSMGDEYNTYVIPGIYDVHITPRGEVAELLAPLYLRQQVFNEAQRFEPYLPTPDAHRDQFTLALYYRTATGEGSNGQEPADDLQVQVYSGGELISSTARSEPGRPGHYRLVISGLPENEDAPVTFRIDAADPADPYPTFSLDRQFIPRPSVEEGERIASIFVPRLDDSWPCYVGTVRGNEGGVAGALVRVSTENGLDPLTGWRGPLRTERTTNSEPTVGTCTDNLAVGSFELRLLEGTYTIEISAPGYAVMEETITIAGSGQKGQYFQLPPQAVLAGSFRTWWGVPIAGATVTARASRASLGDPVTERARFASTWVQDDGEFQLPLDVGIYDIALIPADHFGLPWTVLSRTVQGPGYEIDVGELVSRPPVVVRRRIVFNDRNQTPVAGAEIVAFAILPNRPRVRIGRTVANQEGRFTLLLPPSLEN